MYADTVTGSMQITIDETNRRREKQMTYNKAMGITPAQIVRKKGTILTGLSRKGVSVKAYIEPEHTGIAADPVVSYMSRGALEKAMENTKKNMEKAASELNFIEAARYRDELAELNKLLKSR